MEKTIEQAVKTHPFQTFLGEELFNAFEFEQDVNIFMTRALTMYSILKETYPDDGQFVKYGDKFMESFHRTKASMKHVGAGDRAMPMIKADMAAKMASLASK